MIFKVLYLFGLMYCLFLFVCLTVCMFILQKPTDVREHICRLILNNVREVLSTK